MNLVFDIGNTQYKISVFDTQNNIIHTEFADEFAKRDLQNLINKYEIDKVIFCDTRGAKIEELKQLLPNNLYSLTLTHQIALPITINYKTPETLGKDRIAAAVGAYKLFPSQNNLIIDIGTAITVDFLSDKNVFEGGIISPGQELRFRALHEFTGKLPLVNYTDKQILIGKTTEEAIQQGVQNGIIFELNEYITQYKAKYDNLNVIITGGYSYLFEKKINYRIFAELFLVSIGLNEILNYQKSSDKL